MTKEEILNELDKKIEGLENEVEVLRDKADCIQEMAMRLRNEKCAVEHDEVVNLATLRVNGARSLSLRIPHRFAHDPYAEKTYDPFEKTS